MQMQDTLHRAAERATASGRRLCVLVDTAQAESAHLQLDRWAVPYESLFDKTPEATLREIAPLLVFPGGLDAGAQHRLFTWVERLARSAPCCCWFETDSSPSGISEHLRRFHLVDVSEGQMMIMRWYDTRILPVWLECLTELQARTFAGDTSAWHCVDRWGDVHPLSTLPACPSGGTDPLPLPAFGKPWIELDDEQYASLVDAADLTIMLERVRAVIPDELRRIPSRELAQFVADQQRIAATAGLGDVDRQAQYVLLALYTSGQAGEQAELKAFLESPPASFEAFSAAVQALSDAVWEAGPPLWHTLADSHSNDSSHPAS